MALRSINEIYQQIINEKENTPTLKDKLYTTGLTLDNEQTLLEDLASTSKVAIYRLWAYTQAVVIWFHESLWYQFKNDVDTLIENEFVGTLKWLISKSKEFQYGDDIIVEAPIYHPVYETLDTTKRIIESAAATETGGNIFLKVRRKDSDILTDQELISFTIYMNKIKVAGQKINILNFEADELRLYFVIYYDPIYIINTIKSDVYTVIENYIENIEFNSEVNITLLTDLIQEVRGVKAVQYDEGQLSAGKPYGSSIWTPIENYYLSNAGWNKISSTYPLTSTITFTAKN